MQNMGNSESNSHDHRGLEHRKPSMPMPMRLPMPESAELDKRFTKVLVSVSKNICHMRETEIISDRKSVKIINVLKCLTRQIDRGECEIENNMLNLYPFYLTSLIFTCH